MKKLMIIALLFCCAFKPTDTVNTRFAAPSGYARVATKAGSFAWYLQHLPLKPAGTHTQIYTGAVARTDAYTAAVVDMSIGKRDLQQCADAVMRLRAEYLYQQKRYDDIAFDFTSGFKCDFAHYSQGYRYKNERWVKTAAPDNSYASFSKYLDLVFSYAGTLSLQKELRQVNNAADLQIGDVFIRGGSPGHCFIVVDAARNAAGQIRFMLAQSFMPAQNIQVLQNGTPWFTLGQPANIPYGELISASYLKRF